MLKTMAQDFPIYIMSVFKLARKTCNRIMVAMMHFWWVGFEDVKGAIWCSKDRLTRRKGMGGLGISDMELFNYAMLAMLAWNLICKPKNICTKILRSLYHPHFEFPKAKCSQKGYWS